jgi:hypothetical protein
MFSDNPATLGYLLSGSLMTALTIGVVWAASRFAARPRGKPKKRT